MLSEKRINEVMKKNQKYFDALEASDRTLSRPKAARKLVRTFTIDMEVFYAFQKKCEESNRIMSRMIERWMKEWTNDETNKD